MRPTATRLVPTRRGCSYKTQDQTITLQVGDLASLPKGAVIIWHLTLPFKELWSFGRPYEAPPP